MASSSQLVAQKRVMIRGSATDRQSPPADAAARRLFSSIQADRARGPPGLVPLRRTTRRRAMTGS
jgi:hypothetical protein